MIKEWLTELHDQVQAKGFAVYIQLFLALALFLFVSTPIVLTGLEDNVDGMAGYTTYFLTSAAVILLVLVGAASALYAVSPKVVRTGLTLLFLSLLLQAALYAFLYRKDYGVLDNFVFAKPEALAFSGAEAAVDAAIFVGSLAVATVALARFPAALSNLLVIFILSNVAYAGMSLGTIVERTSKPSDQTTKPGTTFFNYSKTDQNIVLIFVDGSMSGYIPEILRDRPDLAKSFAGFTWYSNVVSTANRTISGIAPLFGGFDYTVSAINAKPGPSLQDKLTPAYAVYVDNFSEKGYDVLYSDPSWYGFERKGNCERFNETIGKDGKARCIHTLGKNIADWRKAFEDTDQFFSGLLKQYAVLSLFKAAPLSLKSAIYGDGEWLGWSYSWRKKEDKYLRSYFSLAVLGEVSAVNAPRKTFTFIGNELTRAPLLVRDTCIPDRTLTPSDADLKRFRTPDTTAFFHTHKCEMQELAKYMDWFRERGIYDNTMIVLVSDHGWKANNPMFDGLEHQSTYSMFQAFLMVKPFGSNGPLQQSTQFISNANVTGMICATIGGCVDRASGKTITDRKLDGVVTMHETPWQPTGQNADSFVTERSYEVHDDMHVPANWRLGK